MMKKNKKKIIILLIFIIVIGALVIGNLVGKKINPIIIQTEKLKTKRIVQTVNSSGYLEPVIQVNISANVSAKIMNITVKEGEYVNEGELLVELDKTRYEAAYERSLSSVHSNKANLKKVKNDLKRTRELYANDLSSESELEAVVAQMEIAESQVEMAQAVLKQSKDDLDKTRIIAPMSGVVTNIRKEKGEIALGSTFQEDVILVVSDMSTMRVKVEVDETDVIDISQGDTAKIEIDAIPDTVFKGIVSEIAHSATTRGLGTQEQVTNFEVKIAVIGQDQRFRPGMSSTADIITNVKDDVVALPIQCLTIRKKDEDLENTSDILKKETNEVVFIVNHPDTNIVETGLFKKNTQLSTVEQRIVKVGISSDTHFEIISGVSEGEEVVTGNYKAISQELSDSSYVKVNNKDDMEKEK